MPFFGLFFHRTKEHKDPFDRLIVWQAIREDLVLISKDDKMDPYRRDFGLKTLW